MAVIGTILILMLPVAIPFFVQPIVMNQTKSLFGRLLPIVLLEIFPVVKIILRNASGTKFGMDDVFFYTVIALELLFGWGLGYLVGKVET